MVLCRPPSLWNEAMALVERRGMVVVTHPSELVLALGILHACELLPASTQCQPTTGGSLRCAILPAATSQLRVWDAIARVRPPRPGERTSCLVSMNEEESGMEPGYQLQHGEAPVACSETMP